MFDKIKKKQNEAVEKQAREKAVQLDAVTLKVIALAAEEKLTVNDFEVVLQQCLNGIKNVYLSHPVSDFVDTPSEPTQADGK